MSNRFSYSKVDCFWSCAYKYKLVYIDKLKAKPDEEPTNALYQGQSIHEAIEKRNINEGLELYKKHFKNFTKAHEFEVFKLELAMKKALEQIPNCSEYEHKLLDDDGFIGYIDGLVKVDEGLYDIYDFKFSNNVSGYKDSGQVHLYKYYFERLTGNKVRDLYYVMIPKFSEKYTEDCDVEKLKQKAIKFYETHDITFEKVEFDRKKINFFFARKALMLKERLFEKRYSFKCAWCEFSKFCSTNGKDRSELLEENECKEVNL